MEIRLVAFEPRIKRAKSTSSEQKFNHDFSLQSQRKQPQLTPLTYTLKAILEKLSEEEIANDPMLCCYLEYKKKRNLSK